MKSNRFSFSALFVLLTIAFAACKNGDYNVSQVTTNDRALLNQTFNPLRSTPQSFSVNAGSPQVINGTEGTRLEFYPNSFKDANGNIITSGNINIQLIEMYTLGMMIANRATTVANGELLISGGQIYISATMNGNEVFANKYSIGFKQTGRSQQPMAIFYGNTNNADSVVTWEQGDTTKVGILTAATVADSFNKDSDYFRFDSCGKFKWINCDYFLRSSQPKTRISVVMPDGTYTQGNTQVYLVIPNIRSVMGIGPYDNTTHTFASVADYGVPIGTVVHLAVIAKKDNNYYYSLQKDITVTENMTKTVTMTPLTLAGLRAALVDL